MEFLLAYGADIFLIGFALFTTIYCLIKGKRVIYECKSGSRFIIPVLFFVCGLLAYIRYYDIVSLVVFIVLVICGGAFMITPSGFGHKEFIVLGRSFPYTKIDDLTYAKKEKDIEISFTFKNRTLFLFTSLDKETEIKDMIKQVRREKAL